MEFKSQDHFVLPASGKRPGEHQWTPGSDVQSLWKRFGWTPPSEQRAERGPKKLTEAIKRPPMHLMRG